MGMIHELAEKLGMESNGYSYFHEENYRLKNDKPCFIAENAEDLADVFSWQRLFKEGLDIVKTKDFLEAVLSNNLADAVGKADNENIQRLPEIVRYVYNKLPSVCWGSPEKVKEWLNS